MPYSEIGLSPRYLLWATDPAHPERGRRVRDRGSLRYIRAAKRDYEESSRDSHGAMPYPPLTLTIERV